MTTKPRHTSPRNIPKSLHDLIDAGSNLAMIELERRVRAALRHKRRAKSFCMAMGSACFYDAKGEVIDHDYPYQPYVAPVFTFIDEFDRYFALTGQPMRIDAPDAPVRRDW